MYLLCSVGVLHPGQKFVVNLNQSVAQLNHYKSDCLSSGFSSSECQPFLASQVFDDGFIQRFGPRILGKKKVENYSKKTLLWKELLKYTCNSCVAAARRKWRGWFFWCISWCILSLLLFTRSLLGFLSSSQSASLWHSGRPFGKKIYSFLKNR